MKFWPKGQKSQSSEGLKQAAGVVGYIALFTLFISNIKTIAPGPDPWWSPLLFLTVFSFSVLTCGLIVLYRPIILYLDKKGREAINLVMWTARWLGIFLLAIILFVAVV